MLKDVLTDALEKLEDYHQAQNRVRDDDQFKTNLRKALDVASSVDKIFALLSEAKLQNILHPTITSNVRNGLITSISNLQGQLHERYLGDSEVREFRTLSETFKNEITIQWRTAANRKAEQVTSSLRLLRCFLAKPEEADALVSKLDNGMQRLPSSQSDIKAFAEAVAHGQKMVDSAGFDDEIKNFLQKVTNSQATLADITSKVQVWIYKQNLETRIKVSFS
jgi:hypothetical protein